MACYTTLLKAVPYKVGTVHVQASRNGPAKKCYMLPCNGCPDRSGHIKKEITAEGQLAGPRYLTTRKFSVNKFVGNEPPTDRAVAVVNAIKRKGAVGPTTRDPVVTFAGT